MGNICYQDNDKTDKLKKSQNQQSLQSVIVIRIGPNPNSVKLHQEAIWLTNQERYHEALQRLLAIQGTQPNYPNIQKMIICSSILLRIQEVYYEGKQSYQIGYKLYQAGKFGEALRRFWYIEKELYQNYKNCRQLIHVCRENYWQEMKGILNVMIAKQIQPETNMQQKLAQILQQLQVTYELLLAAHEGRKKQQVDQEDNDEEEQYKNIRKKSITNFKKNGDPNFNEKPIEKLEINYICFKKPPCKSNSKKSFQHSVCGTVAYIDENCLISCCKSKCQKYPLKDALFSCKKRQVMQRTKNAKLTDYELIDTQMIAIQFLQDCLELDDHSETAQLEFMKKFGQPVMIQYLIENN